MSSLAERLRDALSSKGSTQPLKGDDPRPRALPSKEAAVLIAVTNREEPGVLLTVRREHLRTHAGQIAFPGGRCEPGEEPLEAALREAREEILLDSANVEVVASTDTYRTVTGYMITPVVAVIPAELPLIPHEDEVAELFEAPLAYLMDRSNQNRRTMLFDGRERHYYEINWKNYRIWGATAAMIVNLSYRLKWH